MGNTFLSHHPFLYREILLKHQHTVFDKHFFLLSEHISCLNVGYLYIDLFVLTTPFDELTTISLKIKMTALSRGNEHTGKAVEEHKYTQSSISAGIQNIFIFCLISYISKMIEMFP